MKIYLAGPMRGYPEFNYPAFHTEAKKLRDLGHFVFNPAEASLGDSNIRQCMAVDTAWICNVAEAVALMPGWEKSKGACAEKALADCIGLEIIHL